MNTKLSGRYTAASFFIHLFSFVLLAAVFFYMTSEYARSQTKQQLWRLVQSVSVEVLVQGDDAIALEQAALERVGAATACFLLCFDGQGVVRLSSDADLLGKQVDRSLLDRLVQSQDSLSISQKEELAALLPHDAIVSAQAVQTPLGYRVAAVSASENAASLQVLMRFFSLSAYGVLALSLVVVNLNAKRLVKPLKSMSQAARRFGQGKFDVRVKISGDDEIAQLAVAFNNMADSLEKNERMRMSFITNLSHDLKTPMTIISGFVDGILDGTIPDEMEGHYLELVSDEVRRLSRLVNRLLDLAIFEAGEIELKVEAFDLCELVRQVLFTFERSIREKNLSLDLFFQESLRVRGDVDALHRVVYNIVDNAVKFTPENGDLAVIVEEKDKLASCTVRNSGTGIPREDIDHIFDRFFKTDRSRTLDRRGSGLGLYIAKAIILRHGGSIHADSVEGEFAAVTFLLPSHAHPPNAREAMAITEH